MKKKEMKDFVFENDPKTKKNNQCLLKSEIFQITLFLIRKFEYSSKIILARNKFSSIQMGTKIIS